ncbi:hypothetical protein SANTM175S_06949 [Streptomyces antimycoticus]
MSDNQRRRAGRGGALTLAAALAGSVVLLTAPAAHADTVDVDYQRKTPIGDKSAVSPIDIKSVASGGSYKLTMSFEKGVSSSPVELGKGAMHPARSSNWAERKAARSRVGARQRQGHPGQHPNQDQ